MRHQIAIALVLLCNAAPIAAQAGTALPVVYAHRYCELRRWGIGTAEAFKASVIEPDFSWEPVTLGGIKTTSAMLNQILQWVDEIDKSCPILKTH